MLNLHDDVGVSQKIIIIIETITIIAINNNNNCNNNIYNSNNDNDNNRFHLLKIAIFLLAHGMPEIHLCQI